jgi:hypothetical protein
MAEARRSGGRRAGTTKGSQSKPTAKKQAKTSGSARQAKTRGTRTRPASASSRSQKGSRAGRSAAASQTGSARASNPRAARDNGAPGAGHSKRRGGLSAIEAVERAREHLSVLLGRPVDGVLGIDRDQGNWIVTAQVLELARIPNTTDVLGEYEAVLDRNGEVLGYRRTRRYHRGQVDGAGS